MNSTPVILLGQAIAPEAVAEDMSISQNCCGDETPCPRSALPIWHLNSDVIERARLLAGKTRRELALAAHIDYKTLRDMLNGRRRPTIGTAHCVIRTLALDPKDVIYFPNPKGATKDLDERTLSEPQ